MISCFRGSVCLTQSSDLLLAKENVAGDQRGSHTAEMYSNKPKLFSSVFHSPTCAVGVVC